MTPLELVAARAALAAYDAPRCRRELGWIAGGSRSLCSRPVGHKGPHKAVFYYPPPEHLRTALTEADRLTAENERLRGLLDLQRARADRMESDAHELRAQLDRANAEIVVQLSDSHPADCQPCSEDADPCKRHATDYRYWQARALDGESGATEACKSMAAELAGEIPFVASELDQRCRCDAAGRCLWCQLANTIEERDAWVAKSEALFIAVRFYLLDLDDAMSDPVERGIREEELRELMGMTNDSEDEDDAE